jgi:hypothetical protein
MEPDSPSPYPQVAANCPIHELYLDILTFTDETITLPQESSKIHPVTCRQIP